MQWNGSGSKLHCGISIREMSIVEWEYIVILNAIYIDPGGYVEKLLK